EGTVNLAVIGSYAEAAGDTAGTIEYAVRTARTAVYRLAGTKLEPIPVPNDLLKPDKALKALQVLFK
nr:oleate hydratase [Clostridiales bacterium]